MGEEGSQKWQKKTTWFEYCPLSKSQIPFEFTRIFAWKIIYSINLNHGDYFLYSDLLHLWGVFIVKSDMCFVSDIDALFPPPPPKVPVLFRTPKSALWGVDNVHALDFDTASLSLVPGSRFTYLQSFKMILSDVHLNRFFPRNSRLLLKTAIHFFLLLFWRLILGDSGKNPMNNHCKQRNHYNSKKIRDLQRTFDRFSVCTTYLQVTSSR